MPHLYIEKEKKWRAWMRWLLLTKKLKEDLSVMQQKLHFSRKLTLLCSLYGRYSDKIVTEISM